MSATRRFFCRGQLATLSLLLCISASSQFGMGQSTKGPGGKACPARWKTHTCGGGTVLCVDPDVEMKYDVTAPFQKVECNPTIAKQEIKASQVRGDPFLHGFTVGLAIPEVLWMRALMLNASMVHDGNVEGALHMLGLPKPYTSFGASEGKVDAAIALGNNSRNAAGRLEQATGDLPQHAEGKLACAPPLVVHVCASMILLCVDPEVEEKYDLSDSETFRKAYCDFRPLTKAVLATAITDDPYKAGYSVGFQVLPERFVSVVKVNASQVAGGEMDEVLRTLDLRIPSDWEMKFDEGVDAGANAVIDAARQVEEKAQQMAK
jgi:hypothetical protein